MYDVTIFDPKAELPALTETYRDAEKALVRYHLHYRAGEDKLPAKLRPDILSLDTQGLERDKGRTHLTIPGLELRVARRDP